MQKQNQNICTQNRSKILSEDYRKNHTQKTLQNEMKNFNNSKSKSRTMEWLQIPLKTQKQFAKDIIAIDVDYLQYTCYQISEPLKNLYHILGFSGQIDTDNSNIEYNYNLNLSLTHNDTKMGHAYMITFLSPGFAPIPIASIEAYNPSRVKTLGTQGKIVFYGAYFKFREIIEEEVPEMIRFYNSIILNLEYSNIFQENKKYKSIYKTTRVDIAVDVKTPISQKWLYKYIKPNKNSKHTVKPYNYQNELGGFQSFGYIPKLGQCIGIRVYNKVLDIMSKKKQSWYPNYGPNTENPVVTRMEIIYSGDSAKNSFEDLIKFTKSKLLGENEIALLREIRPKSQYSPLSAYEYFKRYAKNHGKTLKEVLDDVMLIAITEEQKDKDFTEIKETIYTT